MGMRLHKHLATARPIQRARSMLRYSIGSHLLSEKVLLFCDFSEEFGFLRDGTLDDIRPQGSTARLSFENLRAPSTATAIHYRSDSLGTNDNSSIEGRETIESWRPRD